jgi:hypothetical protein
MKPRFALCFYSGLLAVVIYIVFAILAYTRYPLPFSPARNWLRDLGNQIDNPQGAAFYQAGLILTALLQTVWFVGLSQWRVERTTAPKRLLLVAQFAGILASFALIMSALNPINMPEVHFFWSRIHFMFSGIGFGFSVTALRYHPHFSNEILYFGIGAALLPFLTFTLWKGKTYWVEWMTVGLFIFYILAVGKASLLISRHDSGSLPSYNR